MWWHPSPVTIDLGKLRKQTVSKPHCEIWLLRWPAHSSHFSLASPVAVWGQITHQETAAQSPFSEVSLDLQILFHKPSWQEYGITSLGHILIPAFKGKQVDLGQRLLMGISWSHSPPELPPQQTRHPALLVPLPEPPGATWAMPSLAPANPVLEHP